MKKTFGAFICLVASAVMLFSAIAPARARYSSSVTVTEPIQYAKTVGTISIYNPSWLWGYDATADAFDFAASGTYNVHYQIANTATVNGITYANEIETQYYIRLVPVIASDAVLYTSWNVSKYDTKGGKPFDKDAALNAYGPFTLGLTSPSGYDAPSPEFVDIGFTCAASKGDLKGIRTFRVQMFSVRADGSERIISQDDLRIIATNESGRVDIQLDYYSYGSSTLIPNASQTLNVATGTEIDFTDNASLESLGIQIPSGYSFVVDRSGGGTEPTLVSYASSSVLDWKPYYKFTVTGDFSKATPIQVNLIKDDSIPVLLQYWDRSKQKDDNSFTQLDGSQLLQIKKGSVIDFNDSSTLAAAGIKMPDPSVYKYVVSHCNVSRWWHDSQHYFQDRYNVPTDPVVAMAVLDVYVAPVEIRDNIEVVIENDVTKVTATITTTKNASGETQFTYNGVTFTFSADGHITFTYAQLKQMFGNSGYNSFEVFIKNGDNSITVGSAVNSGSVTVDYFNIYQGITTSSTGYCLANSKMQLYIKTWGYVP